MEVAWEKVSGRKFNALTFKDVKGENRPMYELTKLEWLYVATKFNDSERAKLVLRWEQLETKESTINNAKIQQAQQSARRRHEISMRVHDIDVSITKMLSERKMLIKERNVIDNQDYAVLSLFLFPEFYYQGIGSFPNKKATTY